MPEFSAVSGGRLLFGGDYNPMRQAGVNCATVGVLSWARIEPQPGARDLVWLDEVLELLHANGIAATLATPTAPPPPLLGHRHPVLDGPAGRGEAVRRGDTLLLLNHGEDTVHVSLPAPHTDLLTGCEHAQSISLGHFDVAVLAPTP